MLIFKEVFFIFLISILISNPVFAEGNTWGYPSSNSGENNWDISLDLGESWQMSSGKWLRGHLGIDIVMPQGESVYVASDGILEQVFNWPTCEGFVDVCLNGRCTPKWMDNRGWGPTVVIKHEYTPHFESKDTYLEDSPAQDEPQVVYTQYGHLDNVSHLSVGQVVKKGERLAGVGKICDWIPHVHFEIKDQDGLESDIAQSDGDAGFGYSGIDNYALYRYIPQAFIEANKNLTPELVIEELPEPITESQTPKKRSLFSRIKTFFSNLFSSDDVEGEVADTVTTDEVVVADNTPEPSNEPTTDAPNYDADVLDIAPINIGPTDTEVLVTVRARNTGSQAWTQSATSLNVVGGRAPNAPYRHSSWLTDLRPTALDQARVAPGDIGTFTLLLRIPLDQDSITFRTQIVRQAGGQFLQVGTEFAVAQITRGVEEASVEEKTSEDSQQVSPPKTGIIRQIQDVIIDVTNDVKDTVTDTAEAITNTTKQLFFGGGGGSSSSRSGSNDSVDIPDPQITITSPTTSPHHATTSTFELSGTMNDAVRDISVDTSASGTVSFSTTSLTWQWIGTLSGGTTTFYVQGIGEAETNTSADLVVHYAPVYALDAPHIVSPTTSSVWYTSASSTELMGTIEYRATSIASLSHPSSSITLSSSTWADTVANTAEGSVVYTYRASDAFGNTSPTTSIEIVYDVTPPTIVTTTYTLATNTFEYAVVATDTLSGIRDYQLAYRTASSGPIGTCALATSTCTWIFVSSTDASGTIALLDGYTDQALIVRTRVTDGAGNMSTWVYAEVSPIVAEVFVLGPIVFSQIAWMGTEASANDEWIELYNRSEQFIDINGWYITWGAYDEVNQTYAHTVSFELPPLPPGLVLPPGESYDEILFPPYEFLTIERTDNTTIDTLFAPFIYTGALSNDGALLQLWDDNGNLVDRVDMRDGWVAGDNDTKESMVRIDPAREGALLDNWCSFLSCPLNSLAGDAIELDAEGNPIVGSPRIAGAPDMGDPPVQEF